jgi:hypothetical protein
MYSQASFEPIATVGRGPEFRAHGFSSLVNAFIVSGRWAWEMRRRYQRLGGMGFRYGDVDVELLLEHLDGRPAR